MESGYSSKMAVGVEFLKLPTDVALMVSNSCMDLAWLLPDENDCFTAIDIKFGLQEDRLVHYMHRI